MMSGALMRLAPLLATRSIHTAKPTAGIGDLAPSRVSSSS